MNSRQLQRLILEHGSQIMLPDAQNLINDIRAYIKTDDGLWKLYEVYRQSVDNNRKRI